MSNGSGDKKNESGSSNDSNDKKNEFPKDAIRLDVEGGLDFKQITGKCKKCRGNWPLLFELEWCKACILLRVQDEMPSLVVPNKYQTNEGHTDECVICYESTIEDKARSLFICTECNTHTHSDCFKKTQQDPDDFSRSCVMCRCKCWL